MSRFTDKNSDDFGTQAVYMKVRTIGFHQLAVLSDDPLGFREMYRNLNKHNVEMSEITIDKKKNLPLLNPAMLKYKDIKSELPTPTWNACKEIEQDILIKKLCDAKATINLTGKISYKTNNPLEREIIKISLPFINHMMNQKTSLDKPSKEEVEEWEKMHDKLCLELYAQIKKLKYLRDLYSYLIRTYKNPVMPVADFENMSLEQLSTLLNRYKQFGPYQVLEGVNYPVKFMDLVQKQLDAKKALAQEPPSSYSDFDSAYNKAYDQSYVARQSEKIGALLGILAGGYRIYMPYKGEHLRNIARATNKNQSLDTSPSRVITQQDRNAIKSRKDFSEIRSLVDVISTSFGGSHAAMCIGGSTYTNPIDDPKKREADIHFVVVSPTGKLFIVMTISVNAKKLPTEFRDWEALSADGTQQEKTLGWSKNLSQLTTESAKERNEIFSWVGRNFIIWLKEWMESPYMDSGSNEWPGADWYSMATSKVSDWKNSKLYKDLTDQVTPEQSFEDLVNLGCMYWFGKCTDSQKPGKSLAFYENNCTFWGGTLGDIDLLAERYPKQAGLAISEERRNRIEKLKREGKIQ